MIKGLLTQGVALGLPICERLRRSPGGTSKESSGMSMP